MTGTASEVTAALRVMEFEPTENRLWDSEVEATTILLSVDDHQGGALVTDAVTVVVEGVNDAPAPRDVAISSPAGVNGEIVTESTLLRILALDDLVNVEFDFGDEPGEEAIKAAVVLMPTDIDVDSDDDPTTLILSGVSVVGATVEDSDFHTLTTVSDCGAIVTAEFRFDPRESHILYDPRGSEILNALAGGETVVDTFQYVITDRHGATGIGVISITITGVNDDPIANDDLLAAEEDTLLPIPADELLANDEEFDRNFGHPSENGNISFSGSGDTLVISGVGSETAGPSDIGLIATSELGGVVTLSEDGLRIDYDPTGSAIINSLARAEIALDRFRYAIDDGNGGTDLATVTVKVSGINDLPRAIADNASTAEDTQLVMDAITGLLGNDEDDDQDGTAPDDLLRVLPTSPNNDHVVTAQGDGTFSFSFTTDDGAEVAINQDGSYVFDPSVSDVYNALGEGQQLGDTIPYTVFDNSLIVANDDTFSVATGSQSVPLVVLSNDTNLSGFGGDLRLSSITEGPDQGGVLVLGDRDSDGLDDVVIYTPVADFVGMERFRYAISDGLGGTGIATVTVKVTDDNLNGLLATSDDRFIVAAGTGTATLDVLANDPVLPDPGTDLVITRVTGSEHAALAPGGLAIIYTPSTAGSETFSYEISGGGSARAQGSVTVMVVDRSESLVSNDDQFVAEPGSAENRFDVLSNDVVLPASVDPTVVLTQVVVVSAATDSVMMISDDGKALSYTPGADVTGPEVFAYEATDSAGGTGSAQVTVTVKNQVVLPAESGPDNVLQFVAVADRLTLPVGSSDVLLDVLANDVLFSGAAAGAELTITATGLDSDAPSEGRIRVSPDGQWLIYTPPTSGYVGLERFKYEITDGTFRRHEAEVSVEMIARVLDNPAFDLVQDDDFRVEQGAGNVLLELLANDNILPLTAGGWSILEATAPSHGGTLVDVEAATGSLSYTPAPDFIGVETFGYTVIDTFGRTGSALVTIRVGDQRTNADRFGVLAGSVNNALDVLSNDNILPEGADGYEIVLVGVPDKGGSAVVNGSGDGIVYTPAALSPGDDPYPYTETFTYEVVDDSGETVSGSVAVRVYEEGSDRAAGVFSLVVNGVNDAPTFNTDAAIMLTITDKSSGNPFTGVLVEEVDENGLQMIRIEVRIDDPQSGSLTNLGGAGGFEETAPGVYEFTGIAADATLLLQGLIFVPVENWVTVADPPVAETFGFTLSVMDQDPDVSDFLTTTDTSVAIDVTAVNDPPVIEGTLADQIVYYRGSIRAFAGVIVTEIDDHAQQTLTVDVALNDPTHGIFVSPTNLFSDQGGGAYRFVGTAEEATAALGELEFEPMTADSVSPGTTQTTQFTITVDDGFGGVAADILTTVTAIHGFIGEFHGSGSNSRANLGWAVAASNQFVVAGAPSDNAGANNRGAAFVFAPTSPLLDEWGQIQKLVASDGARYDEFGASVDIDGNLLVIGAPLNEDRGSAYVFEWQGDTSGWVEVAKLEPTDGVDDDEFGFAVSIVDGTIAVGAHLDDDGGPESGSVYIFEKQGTPDAWLQAKKIQASNRANYAEFGFSLELSGDSLIVGAPSASNSGGRTGAAYIFERDSGGADNWGEVALRVGSNSIQDDRFGYSVGIDGDFAAVGAPLHDLGGSKLGLVYLFESTSGNWSATEVDTVAADAENVDEFGFSVGLSGEYLIVGMHNDGNAELNQSKIGSAFLFGRNEGGANEWGQLEKIESPTPNNNDEAGYSVAIGGGTVAVGVPFGEPAGANTSSDDGAVVIYRVNYNNGPVARLPIPDQSAEISQSFAFTIPDGAFGDPDTNGSQTLTASGLPGWMSFDAVTATFSGTPGAGELGITSIIDLVLTDDHGLTAQSSFAITVLPPQAVIAGGIPDEILQLAQPSISIKETANSGFVVLRFRALAEGIGSGDLQYFIEGSEDMIRWEYAAGVVTAGVMVEGENVREFVWRSDRPITALPARYFRVRIEELDTGGN
jgi:VCBS repeat-containing protein